MHSLIPAKTCQFQTHALAHFLAWILSTNPAQHDIFTLTAFNLKMDSKVKYLLSLRAVRERSKIVGDAAQAGGLSHFDVHEDRMDTVADFVTSVIKVCLLPYLCIKFPQKTPSPNFHSSAITAQTNSTQSPHMAAGNTLKLEMYLELRI